MKILAALYLLLCGSTLSLFVWCVFGEVRFWSTAQEAAGTVVGLDARRDDESTLYYPIVRFVTPQGRAVTDTSRAGSGPASYAVGEAVRVRYNPANPTQMELPDFFSRWGTILGSGFFALFFGWPLLRYIRRRQAGAGSQPEPTSTRSQRHFATHGRRRGYD